MYALTASAAMGNKGLLATAVGGRSHLAQKVSERLTYDDEKVKQGHWILSIDSANAPEYWPVMDEVREPVVGEDGAP